MSRRITSREVPGLFLWYPTEHIFAFFGWQGVLRALLAIPGFRTILARLGWRPA
jgi:hypothetical protein